MRHSIICISLAFLITGCASDALQSAPARPDQPWKPNITADGVIRPGHSTAAPKMSKLRLPTGFELPPNRELQPRLPTLAVSAGHNYDLPELIDIAEELNPTTRRAWDTARDAALAVGIARSSYLPTLTASIVGGYTSNHQSGSTLRIRDGGSLETQINSQLNNINRGVSSQAGSGEVQTLGLQWLLFDFGNREAVISAAQQRQIASNILFNGTHQKLIYDVTIAFYRHAAVLARLALERDALTNAHKVETASEERHLHAQGTVQDVAQSRQLVAQNALRVVKSEGEAEDSYLTLLTATGLSPSTRIQTLPVLQRPLNIGVLRLTDRLIQLAVSRRPDVLAAYANAKARNADIRAARAAFLPKIFVTGNVAYSTGNLGLSSIPGVGQNSSATLNLSSDRFSSLILGGITVPIFDGGLRSAQLKHAEDQADASQATLQQTLDEAVRQVVTTQNAFHTAFVAFDTASSLVAVSETNFQAALVAYRSGAGSVTQTSVAAMGLADAKISQSDAYYATLVAAASLAFATGSMGGDKKGFTLDNISDE